MTQKQFLETELQNIALQFPAINIKYGYDKTGEVHVVKMIPLHEYYENSLLDKAWIPLSIKFMETFLGEEIAFVSSDSSLDFDECTLEFNPIKSVDELTISKIYNPVANQPMPQYTFPFKTGNAIVFSDIEDYLSNKEQKGTTNNFAYHYPEAA